MACANCGTTTMGYTNCYACHMYPHRTPGRCLECGRRIDRKWATCYKHKYPRSNQKRNQKRNQKQTKAVTKPKIEPWTPETHEILKSWTPVQWQAFLRLYDKACKDPKKYPHPDMFAIRWVNENVGVVKHG